MKKRSTLKDKKHSLWLLFLACSLSIQGQSEKPVSRALQYITQHLDDWQLQREDIADLMVNDQYRSNHNGVTHLYFIQRYAGIEIQQAISGIHLTADGKVGFATNRFIAGISEKVNATTPVLTPGEAIARAAGHLGIPLSTSPRFLAQPAPQTYRFAGSSISQSEIQVQLVYQYLPAAKQLRLAWDLGIDPAATPDSWNFRIDALTGEVLAQNNRTLYCTFPGGEPHLHTGMACEEGLVHTALPPLNKVTPPPTDNASYRVWPLPLESPIYGERELVADPHDLIASPFGWHDIDGQPGAEYQITKGNNVHAYLDPEGENSPAGGEPDGGEDLIFDFPFDPDLEPDGYQATTLTQLFYMNNMMHDFAYAYGFDEAAGNFQANNYGNGGEDGDYVLAEAQDGSATGNPQFLNNANFSVTPDGQHGRMQMYLWGLAGGRLLTVLEPEAIAGAFETSTANYGPTVAANPVEGYLVAAFDDTSSPTLVCEDIVNAEQLAGNIALIDRGTCTFESKTARAEAAGAIAVVVCNYENAFTTMGGVPEVPNPGIPTIMVRSGDCELLRDLLEDGIYVALQVPPDDGPDHLDGALDNGIVAHEYAHGISTRLVAGPSEADCLLNDEQMGEGWSDFFALVATVRPGDTGQLPRGIANYAYRSGVNGTGARRMPYSTDFGVNNQVYDDIIGTTQYQSLGEIWAATLWDFFWRLVEEYGWDEDLRYGTGGNNIAIQLVMDGLKLQACNPGFTDGRDAILAADTLNYNGSHSCLIWEVFARRGIGFGAQQNNPLDRNDGLQSFEQWPACVKELKIAKTVTPLIEAGEDIEVTLVVTNHKETMVSSVVVTDEIPAGTTLVAGSPAGPAEVTLEGDLLVFSVGNLATGESLTLTYTLQSSPDLFSILQYKDDMENGDDDWIFIPLRGDDYWQLYPSSQAYSGQYAWFVPNAPRENDQVLRFNEPMLITGAQPVLRFQHRYQIEPGIDGGFVQLSTDGGATWEKVDDLFFRNGYRGPLAPRTLATPGLQAFWGNSDGYVDSYLDLSEFVGEEILLRFRFGSSEEENGGIPIGGWYVDDVELFDLFNYDTEACVSSAQGDQACNKAPQRGTLVEPELTTSTDQPTAGKTAFRIYPNPAGDWIQVEITSRQTGSGMLELLSLDSRPLLQKKMDLVAGPQQSSLQVAALPAGLYLLRLRTGEGSTVKKIIIR